MFNGCDRVCGISVDISEMARLCGKMGKGRGVGVAGVRVGSFEGAGDLRRTVGRMVVGVGHGGKRREDRREDRSCCDLCGGFCGEEGKRIEMVSRNENGRGCRER